MRKALLALTATIVILTGCQDEKPAETTPVSTPPATEVKTTADVAPSAAIPSDTAPTDSMSADSAPSDTAPIEEEQVITTETFVNSDDNAQNMLDWDGIYKGKLPCADCSDIDTTLTLNEGGTYSLVEVYEGKEGDPIKSEGKFTWNQSGDTITLADESEPNQYFVGENMLMKLDMNGEKATGELAPFYNLSKMP